MPSYAQLLPSYDFIEKFEINSFLTSVLLTKTRLEQTTLSFRNISFTIVFVYVCRFKN